jgi:hypothetical protein
MHGFYTEHRSLPLGSSLSRDLAQHIFIRSAKGSVAIVTEKPHDLLSTTKKQWQGLIRQVERERASTLKLSRIAELSNQIEWMHTLLFTAKLEKGLVEDSVVFATPLELSRQPPICSTLYIIQHLTKEEFRLITSRLPPYSVAICYRLADLAS